MKDDILGRKGKFSQEKAGKVFSGGIFMVGICLFAGIPAIFLREQRAKVYMACIFSW